MILGNSGKVAGSVVLAFLLLSAAVDAFSQNVAGDNQPVSQSASLTSRERSPDEKIATEKDAVPAPTVDRAIAEKKPVADTWRTVSPGSFGSSSTNEAAALDKMRNELNSAKKQSGSGWEYGFAPYLYATGLHGTVAARGREMEVDLSFGDVMSNFDIGIMGAFEARKGKLSLLSDLLWIKLSDEAETPGGLYNTVKVGVNTFIFDPEVGYQLTGSDKGRLDVVGGVRIWSVETNINVTTGLLPGFDVSQRKTWAAPVVGLRGTYDLTPKFYISSKFDIGGFGIGADLTTQFYGGVGYRFTKHIAAVGGYRFLLVDYDDEQGFKYDTNMNGILFGAKFTF